MRIYLDVCSGGVPPSIICSLTIDLFGCHTYALRNTYPFIDPCGIHLL